MTKWHKLGIKAKPTKLQIDKILVQYKYTATDDEGVEYSYLSDFIEVKLMSGKTEFYNVRNGDAIEMEWKGITEIEGLPK